jgi:20S proteasome alpha/beta subunit
MSREDRYTTSLLVVVSSGSRGQLEVSQAGFSGDIRNSYCTCLSGSGSTYVYGYCDATYKEGMSEDETVNFVRNSKWNPAGAPLLALPRNILADSSM